MTLKATKDSSTQKKPKVTVTDSKTEQATPKDRKKTKKSAVVEVEEVVEASKVSKKRSKKVQSQPVVEEKVEVVEEKVEVVKEKKQKKGKKEGAAGSVAKPEKPAPAPAPAPEELLPVSISAPRKSSTTSKSPKASDKASKFSKKAKAKETPPAPVPQEPLSESISTSPKAPTISKSNASDKTSKKSKKAKAKEISPSPEPEVLSEEEAAEADSEKENEDLHLHGFSTDDDDSSDDDDTMDHEPSAFDIAKLPTIAKDDATVKRKLEKAKRQPTEDRGVLFLGRIPHGFYEDQMRGYFSQFGTVTRVRLSRNKKTGRSKHYGFLEFDSSSVAQIVADTMDNYLLMGHILRCKVIPKDEVHPELWVGANRKWRAVPHDRVTRVEHNKPRTEDQQVRANKRLIKRQNERKRKLADAGIKYDFEAVGYKKAKGIQA